jgi:hypothetical protein
MTHPASGFSPTQGPPAARIAALISTHFLLGNGFGPDYLYGQEATVRAVARPHAGRSTLR